MSFRGKIMIAGISMAIALYVFVGGFLGNFFSSYAQQPINDSGAQLRIFESVLQHIQNDYVDEPPLDKVRAGALRGLAYGLDPYSSYLTAEQVQDFQARKNVPFAGIGAEFSQVSSYLYVVAVVKDSPADKAGLKAGDVIEYIEAKATRDISLYDARQLIAGENGTSVKLRVLRPGERAQTLTVTRGSFRVPTVEARLEVGKVGYIRVFSLGEGAAADIRGQLQNFGRQGVQKIVLDLRNVADGKVEEGVEVANLFIKSGTLAQVLGRENKVVKTFAADASKAVFDGKIVALIDVGTAGASEVVASALAETKRGDVVGERSFGAGTEQQLFQLKGGDGLLLTVAKWASSTGVPFLGEDRAKSGVKPTVEVRKPDTPDPVEVEELVDQSQNPEPNAQPTPAATPKKQPAKPTAEEDIQLRKAVELLQDKPVGKTE